MNLPQKNIVINLSKRKDFISLGIMLCVIFSACQQDYSPKPLGYNRLNLPVPAYHSLPDSLPYTFEYSLHAKLLDDTPAINEKFWIEI